MITVKSPPSAILVLALGLGAVTASAAAAPQYHLVPIEIDGAENVFVADMNDAGLAVGYYVDADTFQNRPFLWDGQQAHRLPVPADREEGQATGINGKGQIVGYASTILKDGAVTTALLWNAADLSQYAVIEGPSGTQVNPDDINDVGVVVGLAATDGQFNAFEWSVERGFVDDGVPNHGPGTQAYWAGINNAGVKLGGWYFPGTPSHATIGQAGVAGIAPIAAGVDDVASKAYAANEAGLAVGEMDLAGNGKPVPVTFRDGTATAVPGALLGLAQGIAFDVNERGTIVGRAYDFATLAFKAFVHVDGVSYDIAAQADNGTLYEYLLNAVAVAEDGTIAGTARGPNFTVASYVAVPVVVETIFADGFEQP